MGLPIDAALEHLHAGRPAEAEALLRRHLQRAPRDAEGHRVMGVALGRLGKIDQAKFYFERAIAGFAAGGGVRLGLVHLNLGNALLGAGRAAEALPALRRAAELLPGSVESWNSLCAAATAAGEPGSLDEAIRAGERAMALAPDHPHVLLNLGSALGASGDAEASLKLLERAAALAPDDPHVLSTLLMASNYDPARTPGERAGLHRELGARLGADQAGAARARERGTGAPAGAASGRLRVGYLSFDLRRHVVAVFMRGVLAAHDRARLEVFAYQTGPEDQVSRELAGLVDHWVSAAGMSDEQIVERMRRDGLDLLVDLSGHTDGSRPGVLARRGAPVQATYLGYPNTTGIPAVDFRIVDAVTDPPGEADGWSTERLVRLPRCFLAFAPPMDAPAPASVPPSVAAGAVTFGSFNNASKVNPPLLRAWARVLAGAPGSRLLIKNKAMPCVRTRERWLAVIAESGVEAGRVELRGWDASERHHLAAYQEVDVALDTYPYHGTTTTCEALWMGVPVVTRAGAAHVSRVGASLLGAVGLEELVCADEGVYIAKAIELARDPGRLRSWREGGATGLRARMAASPLCDAVGLARALEAAYGAMCSG
ncbi:MAG: tetratricopeptide repeat protein [Phycisphaerales bacterium]